MAYIVVHNSLILHYNTLFVMPSSNRVVYKVALSVI